MPVRVASGSVNFTAFVIVKDPFALSPALIYLVKTTEIALSSTQAQGTALLRLTR